MVRAARWRGVVRGRRLSRTPRLSSPRRRLLVAGRCWRQEASGLLSSLLHAAAPSPRLPAAAAAGEKKEKNEAVVVEEETAM